MRLLERRFQSLLWTRLSIEKALLLGTKLYNVDINLFVINLIIEVREAIFS